MRQEIEIRWGGKDGIEEYSDKELGGGIGLYSRSIYFVLAT